MSKQEQSITHRKLGNKEYRRSENATLSPQEKVQHLEAARTHYLRAYRNAANHNDRASAAKNVAMSAYSSVSMTSHKQKTDSLRLAIKFFTRAISHGEKARMKPKWIRKLSSVRADCCCESITMIEHMDPQDALDTAELFLTVFVDDITRFNLYTAMFGVVYPFCVTQLNNGSSGQALGMLRESARLLADIAVSTQQVNDIRSKIERELVRAEALQKLNQANKNLEQILANKALAHSDVIFELIDWYSQVARLTEDMQLETTSMAYEKLSVIYTELLKDAKRAKENDHKAEAFSIGSHSKPSPTKKKPVKQKINPVSKISQVPQDSESVRLRGNDAYNSAKLPKTPTETKINLLHQALQLYQSALKIKANAKEKAQAAKNIATTCYTLAEVNSDPPSQMCLKYLKDGMLYTKYAKEFGQSARCNEKWIKAVHNKYTEYVKFGLVICEPLPPNHTITNLSFLLDKLLMASDKMIYCDTILNAYKTAMDEFESEKHETTSDVIIEINEVIIEIKLTTFKSLKDKAWYDDFKQKRASFLNRGKSLLSLHHEDVQLEQYLKLNKTVASDIRNNILVHIDNYMNVARNIMQESADIQTKAYFRLYQLYNYGIRDKTRGNMYKDKLPAHYEKNLTQDNITILLKELYEFTDTLAAREQSQTGTSPGAPARNNEATQAERRDSPASVRLKTAKSSHNQSVFYGTMKTYTCAPVTEETF